MLGSTYSAIQGDPKVMATTPAVPVVGLSQLPPEVKTSIMEQLDLRSAASASLASISLFKTARQAATRQVCCVACGHALFHPRDSLPVETNEIRLTKNYSSLRVTNAPGVKPGMEYVTTDDFLRYQMYVRYGIRAGHRMDFAMKLRELLCGGCGLMLGCRFLQIYAEPPKADGSSGGVVDGEDEPGSSDDDEEEDEDEDDGPNHDRDRRSRVVARKELLEAMYLTVPFLYCGKGNSAVAPDQNAVIEMAIRAPVPRDWPQDFSSIHVCAGHHRDGSPCQNPLFKACNLVDGISTALHGIAPQLGLRYDNGTLSARLVNGMLPSAVATAPDDESSDGGALSTLMPSVTKTSRRLCHSCGSFVGFCFVECHDNERSTVHMSRHLLGRFCIFSTATQLSSVARD